MSEMNNITTENYLYENTNNINYELYRLTCLMEGKKPLDEQGWRSIIQKGAQYADDILKKGKKFFSKTDDVAGKLKTKGPYAATDDLIDAVGKTGNRYQAARAYMKKPKWNWYQDIGKSAGAVVNPFSKASKGSVMNLVKYMTKLTPVPVGRLMTVARNLGLGPALLVLGEAFLRKYMALVLIFTVVRFVLQLIEEVGIKSISQLNRYLKIPEYEASPVGDYLIPNLIHNFVKSGYLPDALWIAPGWLTLPYIYQTAKGLFLKDKGDWADNIVHAHDVTYGEINNMIGISNTIPSDLLSEFPSSERGKVKMDDNGGVYWDEPKYKIASIGGSGGIGNVSFSSPEYIMLIPGDGWYKIEDIDF
jgi:hypothetical protein